MSTLLKEMERVNFKTSTKNIPFSKPETYLKRLIEKTEHFIRRMRWKAFFFLNPSARSEIQETYGFNSTKTPPPIPEMSVFERKMGDMIKNVKFRPQENNFQKQLSRKIKEINKDDKILVKADKTSNFYKNATEGLQSTTSEKHSGHIQKNAR